MFSGLGIQGSMSHRPALGQLIIYMLTPHIAKTIWNLLLKRPIKYNSPTIDAFAMFYQPLPP